MIGEGETWLVGPGSAAASGPAGDAADDRLRLSAEKTALERMIARTPASQVIDRASLTARLRNVVVELEALPASTRSDDAGQVRRSLDRLSQANLREDVTELTGAFQGVLPKSRSFEFCLADSQQVVKGRISPSITEPAALNGLLHRPLTIKVLATTVGSGRPRYLLLEMPSDRR